MLKNKAFEKLRLSSKVATAVAGVGLALGVAALPAKAAVVGLPLAVDTGNAGWGRYSQASFVNSYSGINNFSASMVVTAGGATSGDPAYRIGDAYLLTTGGGSLSDAFDSFAGIRVNGTFFQQPSAQVDRTTTGAGTFLNTLTPQNIGGINTSLDYFFDNSSPTARVLATFTNTTGSSQSVEVLYGGALGSDTNTIIEASSSGDNVFQQADRWFVSSDTAPFFDPVLTFSRYGTGTVQTASNTYAVPGTDSGIGSVDYFTDVWNLNVGAGETQRLMWFVQLSETVATAVTNATTTFTNLTSLNNDGLLEGLSTSTQNEIVNWESQQTPPTTPEPSTLLGLGSLLLLGGFSKRKGKKTEDSDNSGDLG